METPLWYNTINKPPIAPPAWVFGPVWSILYLLIAISFGFVFWKVIEGELPAIVALPFALNLILNASFTYAQVGLNNQTLAAVIAVLMLATLVWGMILIRPYFPWVSWTNIPYALWVGFASILQIWISAIN